MKKASLSLILFFSLLSNGFSQTISIGSQVWTAKNLNVTTFRNGDAIPELKTQQEWVDALNNKQPGWCYYNNDVTNGKKYGILYNWFAINDARGLAPLGYHIPTEADWITLKSFLGEVQDEIGKKMKSTSGWYNNDGTNSSGFTGLPGGSRWYDGSFQNIGYNGSWWCSTLSFIGNFTYSLSAGNGYLLNNDTSEIGGHSVRCVKD